MSQESQTKILQMDFGWDFCAFWEFWEFAALYCIYRQTTHFKLPIKTERNGLLPTLDIKTCRKHGKRFASIYGKDTLYNVYINFSSIQEFRFS